MKNILLAFTIILLCAIAWAMILRSLDKSIDMLSFFGGSFFGLLGVVLSRWS